MTDLIAPRFLPWLRIGLAAQITEPAVAGLAAHDTTTMSVSVRLRADGASELVEAVPSPDIGLLGPGNVVGIDQSLVVRRDPEPGTTDAEDTYLALVEFSAPDLPWKYTPAAAADDRLQPWIALVVVEEREGVWLETGTTTRLPILHVDEASRELPDLRQCWAWAHVQADHDLASGTAAALEEAPEVFRSRLLCPRRLLPHTAWLACVVPTFAAGRQAGLGETISADMGLAWDSATGRDVRLPVYHSWRFETGPSGDFESLVRRLRARELPASVGRRDLDISNPGSGLPVGKGAVISYQGALLSPAGTPRPWPAVPRQAMKEAIRALLNAQRVRPATPSPYDALRDDPVVGPPAYVAAQAGRSIVPPETKEPLWFGELNTEPQHRSVAGVAAAVIRRDQETLMATAWDYAASARQATQILTRARTAWEVARLVRPRLDTLSDEVFLQVAGPAMARLRHPSGATIKGVVNDSALPAGLVSGAFRRVACTVLARGTTSTVAIADSVTRTALADSVAFVGNWADVWPPAGADLGGVELEQNPTDIHPGPILVETHLRTTSTPATAQTRDYVLNTPASVLVSTLPYTGDTASLFTLAANTRGALDPLGTITAMVNTMITGLEADREQDVPDRIFVRPVFQTAMYRRLVELSAEYLVPGIGDVPSDTLGLLETNPPFVEAFMAGLNHEMGREFVWREYPARLQGTWFQYFWQKGSEGARDIVVIGSWKSDALLGSNAPEGTPTAKLVLLIKSALLRRYPDIRIYAAEAMWENNLRREATGGDVKLPLFAARLAPDVAAYAFDLDEELARGSKTQGTKTQPRHPGYFFVLEQPAVEPRFGLDAEKPNRAGQPPTNWANLSWSHLVEKGAPLSAFVDPTGPTWLVAAGALSGNGGPGAAGKDIWGDDAAAMARITFQRPVRMLVHADSMLPEPAAAKGAR